MKRWLLLALLLASPAGASDLVCAAYTSCSPASQSLTYTGNNTFSGTNTFSGSSLFTGRTDLPGSTTPPATCTAGKQVYIDTDATSGSRFLVCESTNTWVAQGGSTGLTVGTTPVASGTTTKVLYDNAGTLGEYTVSGSGNVCMSTSCSMTTPALGAATYTTLSGGAVTDSALTSGRLTFAGTAGLLADDSDLTFSTDTLTVTKIAATTHTGALTMSGANIILGSNYLSGDGGNEGVSVDASGNTTISGTFSAASAYFTAAVAGINLWTEVKMGNGNLAFSATAPSISGTICTSASIGANPTGTAAFTIVVGTACTGVQTGTLTMPAAAHGWVCDLHNTTNPAGNKPDQTGGSTTTVTFTNYARTTGLASDFTASDVIRVQCTGY